MTNVEEIDVCPDLDVTRMHAHYQNIAGSSYLCVTFIPVISLLSSFYKFFKAFFF